MLWLRGGVRLGRLLAVIDPQARLEEVQARDLDHLAAEVEAGDLCGARRERLRQQPAAAAHVGDARSREPAARSDVIDPHRVEVVQGAGLAVGVPPARRQRRKALQFGRIEIALRAHASSGNHALPARKHCQRAAFARSASGSRSTNAPSRRRRRPPIQTSLTSRRLPAYTICEAR